MVSSRIFAALMADKLHKATKELLLGSPAFHRFAQESSKRAQSALDEAAKAAQPHIARAEKMGREALKDFEKTTNGVGKK